jgi:hypothetical protein
MSIFEQCRRSVAVICTTFFGDNIRNTLVGYCAAEEIHTGRTMLKNSFISRICDVFGSLFSVTNRNNVRKIQINIHMD